MARKKQKPVSKAAQRYVERFSIDSRWLHPHSERSERAMEEWRAAQ